MDKSLYRLEYRSNMRSITFNTYLNMNTHITLSSAMKFYNFRENDILDEKAVAYYKLLEPDVRLVKFRNAQEVKPVAPSVSVSKPIVPKAKVTAEVKATVDAVESEYTPGAIADSVLEARTITEDIKVTEDNSASAGIADDSKVSEYKVGSADNDGDTMEEDAVPEMSKADLCEYLDLNYTEDGLRAVAKELSVDFGKLKRKDSMISKLVRERFDDALALVKK